MKESCELNLRAKQKGRRQAGGPILFRADSPDILFGVQYFPRVQYSGQTRSGCAKTPSQGGLNSHCHVIRRVRQFLKKILAFNLVVDGNYFVLKA